MDHALQVKLIKTPEEYKDVVEKFFGLADAELQKFERLAQNPTDLYSVAESLPKLISLVNVIGYMRGQDNAFLDVRPPHLEFQKDLYENENRFEARLKKLIDVINSSPEKEHARRRLEEYFLRHRGV